MNARSRIAAGILHCDRSDESGLRADARAALAELLDTLEAADTQVRAALAWLERRNRYEGERREDCIQYAESHARAALHLAGFPTEAGNPLTPSPVSESDSDSAGCLPVTQEGENGA